MSTIVDMGERMELLQGTLDLDPEDAGPRADARVGLFLSD